jgi:hypothetical protein
MNSPAERTLVDYERQENTEEELELEREFMAARLTKAQEKYKLIMQAMENVKKVVEAHRTQINPQLIIAANSELGNLQRFYVRPKYKEMVKGCGSGRTQYGIAWAGTIRPGDAWMNDLLRCYWRELENRKFEWTILNRPLRKKDPETGDEEAVWMMFGQENEADLELKRKVEFLSMKTTNNNVLDAIDFNDLMAWIKFTRRHPDFHSAWTREVVETAIEKMGGWKLYDIFLHHWARQFYLEMGKSNIPFPLPGCRTWWHDIDSTVDGSIKSFPSSLSLPELHQESLKMPLMKQGSGKDVSKDIPHAESFMEMLSKVLQGPTHQDTRHYNMLCRSICKDLINLHNVLDSEFDNCSEQALKDWMRLVDESELLSKGKYKDYGIPENVPFDDSFTDTQKHLLHPALVKIREKGIVINAYFEPGRYSRLHALDVEIRRIFSVKLVKKAGDNKSSGSFSALKSLTSSAHAGSIGSGGKSHKKSFSTGGAFEKIFSRFNHRNIVDDDEDDDDGKTVKTNIGVPSSQSPKAAMILTADSLGRSPHSEFGSSSLSRNPGTKMRTSSAPNSPTELYGETVSIFVDIRELCQEIAAKKELISVDLIRDAFERAERVVRHYLTEELPAKYQAVY